MRVDASVFITFWSALSYLLCSRQANFCYSQIIKILYSVCLWLWNDRMLVRSFPVALRPQKPYRLLGTGSPGLLLDFHTAECWFLLLSVLMEIESVLRCLRNLRCTTIILLLGRHYRDRFSLLLLLGLNKMLSIHRNHNQKFNK